eukprot:2663088-Rhodomonas_salina.9
MQFGLGSFGVEVKERNGQRGGREGTGRERKREREHVPRKLLREFLDVSAVPVRRPRVVICQISTGRHDRAVRYVSAGHCTARAWAIFTVHRESAGHRTAHTDEMPLRAISHARVKMK